MELAEAVELPMHEALYDFLNVDAFRWLKDAEPCSIHAVVTDPPYGLVEYSPVQLEKRRSGNGGVWRLPPSYDGSQRQPVPRFTVLTDKDKESAPFTLYLESSLGQGNLCRLTVMKETQNHEEEHGMAKEGGKAPRKRRNARISIKPAIQLRHCSCDPAVAEL